MQAIQVKHIGPLVDTGRVPITQVVLLIGEQSTGKSTFMKILCFCSWIEKQLMIDGKSKSDKHSALYNYTHYYRFWNDLKKFHHFNDDFFREDSYIKYEGQAVTIEMRGRRSNARITLAPNFAECKHNLKLCFLPSERNLLSSIQNIESLYRSKEVDVLFNYILEWKEACAGFDAKHPLDLVFAERMSYHYDVQKGDVLTLNDGQQKIKPYYASSGVQSALPIQLLATYLAEEVGKSARISPKEYLTNVLAGGKTVDKNQMVALMQDLMNRDGTMADLVEALSNSEEIFKQLQQRLTYKSFHLFIEELEQNLFPNAQFELIKLLVGLIAKKQEPGADYGSSIFLTTHSPYVLTALNVLMLAAEACERDAEKVIALGMQPYVLRPEAYSAYCIKDGRFEDMMDKEYHFIQGDYLDAISDEVDEYTYQFNQIIYGNTEGAA